MTNFPMPEQPATCAPPSSVTASPPIGLALSSLLGNKTISQRLTDIVRSEFGLGDEPLWFGSTEDYHKFESPRWMRRFSRLEGEYVFRRKLWSLGTELPRIVVACTLEVAAAVMACDRDVALVVATDSTPRISAKLDRIIGIPLWKRQLKAALNTLLAWRDDRLIRHVRAWLPMSEACKRSLVNDYGVDPRACFVTRSPQVEIASAPPTRDTLEEFRLLMVANDFVLKGGPALLGAVHSLERVRLTIISNDAVAKSLAEPGKIDVVSGLTSPQDIRPYYRAAHLLVHPTRRDCYSHVLCEALAQGCPVAVTEEMPPAEIVQESGAGWLIPRPANSRAIAALIANVRTQPNELSRRAEAAIEYAQSRLSMEQFGAVVRGAVLYGGREVHW